MSRSAPVAGPSISLFPFLAVLLCTMGSLLVLLVLFSRSAKHGETAEAARVRQEIEAELELARDELVWRRQQLDGVRGRTAEDLARARLQLAGIEENSRSLVDELESLERSAAALAGAAVPVDEAVLVGLETRLKSSRESLEKARAERDSKPPAYAVVPYVGSSGTHRRPLYIECCGDGVFLQPEGIRLSPGDFDGPPGPGNPLACALRVAREHIVASQGGTNDPAAQPYPLLLVRPSGVMAYYAAREAIQSWGSDFGYQLIDEDWTLAFPPADPMLAQLEKRAIEESRARLAWLADARPAKPVRPVRHYRAAPTRGGVVADGGPSVLGDQSRFDWANQQQEQADRGGVGSGSALGTQTAGGGAGAGGSGTGGGNGGTSAGDRSARMGGSLADGGGGGFGAAGRADGASGDVIFGGGSGKTGGPGSGGPAGAAASGDRYAGGTAGGTFSEAARGGGAAPGSAGGLAASGAGGAVGGQAAGGTRADGRAGGTQAAGPSGAGQSGAGPSGSGQSGTGQSGSGQAGGGVAGGGDAPAMPGLHVAGGGEGGMAGAVGGAASASMAHSRGKNWASLATQERPIPLTRPIRVECSAHEFRILDDSGRRVQTRIPVDADTITAIDPLIGAIHARVQGWGLAGDRMYWRPQLVLSETADGRGRREDLERLLADSGIDTRSPERRDQVRPLPPVTRSAAVLGR